MEPVEMLDREFWWAVALFIAVAGLAAIVKVFADDHLGAGIPLTLLATLTCGGVALCGLALLERPAPILWLGIAFLVGAVVAYVLLEIAAWNLRFGERHYRFVLTVVILVIAGLLLSGLAAAIRGAGTQLRLLVVATVAFIAAATLDAIALTWTHNPSKNDGRVAELFVILALVGFLGTPVVQRALRRSQRPPRTTATPSPSP